MNGRSLFKLTRGLLHCSSFKKNIKIDMRFFRSYFIDGNKEKRKDSSRKN